MFLVKSVVCFLAIISTAIFAATPIANYKFDESAYLDIDGEVTDSISALNGQARFSESTVGKVCKAIDLTRVGVDDFVELPNDVLEDKDAFSISTWFKTSKTGEQAILSLSLIHI